eukprot:scaffold14030_cov48-Phaeocystis_antarctica.AAC.1
MQPRGRSHQAVQPQQPDLGLDVVLSPTGGVSRRRHPGRHCRLCRRRRHRHRLRSRCCCAQPLLLLAPPAVLRTPTAARARMLPLSLGGDAALPPPPQGPARLRPRHPRHLCRYRLCRRHLLLRASLPLLPIRACARALRA